eukprot:5874014-Pleurochrysis_carterae.AAC.1
MELAVMNNSFEDACIELEGEGFVQDVAFEDMPDDADGEALKLGEVEVGASSSLSFTMRNHSDVPHRFAWPSLPGVTFSPSVGHIHAHAAKQVVVTFCSDKPVVHSAVEVKLSLQRIQYAPGAETDWDDTMKVVKWLSDA